MAMHSVIHKAFIQFDCESADKVEKIIDKAFEYSYAFEDLDFEASSGGPAHGPYMVIESESERDVKKLTSQIENYMKKFTGLTIIC